MKHSIKLFLLLAHFFVSGSFCLPLHMKILIAGHILSLVIDLLVNFSLKMKLKTNFSDILLPDFYNHKLQPVISYYAY